MIRCFSLFILFTSLAVPVAFSSASSREQSSEQILEEILSQLPNRELSLEFVLIAAINYADAFQAIKVNSARSEVTRLTASSPFDPRLRVGGGYLYDEAERSNAFEPQSIRAGKGVIGLDVLLPSGTAVSAEIDHSKNRVALSSSIDRYWETKANLGVRQNLLKDAFGYATRKNLESASFIAGSIQSGVAVEAENFLLSIIEQFHQAWLSQKRLRSAEENLVRRKRLLDGVKARRSRGAASEADLLQAESAYMNAEIEKDQAQLNLNEIWRSLILVLKLDEKFLLAPAQKIPLPLEASFEEASTLCRELQMEDIYKKSGSVLKATADAEAAKSNLRAARNRFLPSLDLVGKLGTGNVDSSFSDPLSDSLQGENPRWSLGIEFSIPLFHRKERSDLMEAEIRARQAERLLESSRTEARVRWRNACEQVSQYLSELKALDAILNKQKRRENLENDRFRVGSVGVFSVVQAGDDLAQVESRWRETQIRLRRESWRVAQLGGGFSALFAKAFEKSSATGGSQTP